MKHVCYIGIGSNLGDRLVNCKKAIEYIGMDLNVFEVSDFFENKAVTLNNTKEPDYINCALKAETTYNPSELLGYLKRVENKMGRPREHDRWSSRVIDLDILFYDDLIINTAELVIPHPEIEKRIFVLKPLCDIDTTFIHPVLKRNIKDLLGDL